MTDTPKFPAVEIAVRTDPGRDPDKPAAACVYLWTRSPSLCNAPAMAGKFNKSRTDGQLILPSGAMCKVGPNSISLSTIARLNILVKDRDVAYTALLARLAESTNQRATTKEILGAEQAVIQYRFGGSRSGTSGAIRGRSGWPCSASRSEWPSQSPSTSPTRAPGGRSRSPPRP